MLSDGITESSLVHAAPVLRHCCVPRSTSGLHSADRGASGAAGSGSEARVAAGSRHLYTYVRRLVASVVWRIDLVCGAALAEATDCSQSRHVILPSLQICTSCTAIGSL